MNSVCMAFMYTVSVMSVWVPLPCCLLAEVYCGKRYGGAIIKNGVLQSIVSCMDSCGVKSLGSNVYTIEGGTNTIQLTRFGTSY